MLSWWNAPCDSTTRGFCPFSCPLNIPCLSVLPQSEGSNKDFCGSPHSLSAVTVGCWLPEFAGPFIRGLKRCTDLVTKAVQTRRAASQQSAPGAEVLKGIGYCLGLVREEFVAKGFAVGASQAWTMKVFAQLTVHVLLLIMHHQTLIMWTSKYA